MLSFILIGLFKNHICCYQSSFYSTILWVSLLTFYFDKIRKIFDDGLWLEVCLSGLSVRMTKHFLTNTFLENMKTGIESFQNDHDRSRSRSRSSVRSRSPVRSSPSRSREGSPKSPPRGGGILPPYPFGLSREELIQPLSIPSSTSPGFHQVKQQQ